MFDDVPRKGSNKCTFGISYSNFRSVVLGSPEFLGHKRYPFFGKSTKCEVISEKINVENPGPIYELKTTLKERNYNLSSSTLPDNDKNTTIMMLSFNGEKSK